MDSQLAKNLVSETAAIHPEMPWLDIHGRSLSGDVLKIETMSWKEKTWEAYLKTLEAPTSESLTSTTSFQTALDSGNCINDFLASTAKQSIQEAVKLALQRLTPLQTSIIKMTFWSGMSERAIAANLGLSRSSVKTTKKRAIGKLQRLEVLRPTFLAFSKTSAPCCDYKPTRQTRHRLPQCTIENL